LRFFPFGRLRAAFAKDDRGMPVIGDSSHKKSIKNSGQKL